MQFRYQVLDKNKQTFQGDIEAETIERARLSLLRQGYDVLLLESVKERYVKRSFSTIGIVSLKEKMLFAKHLSLMIKSGMLIDESIEVLQDQAKGRMKKILEQLLAVVRKGNFLSEGLKLFPYTFNDFFVNMVRIGEQSGTLEKNFVNLSIKLKKDSDLKKKIIGALAYPAIIIAALLGLGVTLSVVVLPKLLGFFEQLDIAIPIPTRIFLFTASAINSYWVIGTITMIGLVVGTFSLNKMRKTQHVIHWTILHLPIARKFSMTSNLANICRSLGLTLDGGVTLDEALEIMSRAASNELYRRALLRCLDMIRKGEQMSNALALDPFLFPPLVTKMVHVGEVSGTLAETFTYLAEFYEDELDDVSRNVSSMLEPLLLTVMGLIVGFVAYAIITPIYQITGGISR